MESSRSAPATASDSSSPPAPDAPAGPPPDPTPSRSEIALEGRAARQCWPIDPAKQGAIAAGLVDLATGDARPRTRITAARALAAFGRLAMDQQKLDAQAADPAAAAAGDPLVVLDVRDILLDPRRWAQAVQAVEAACDLALQEGQRRAGLSPAARDQEYRDWVDQHPHGLGEGGSGGG